MSINDFTSDGLGYYVDTLRTRGWRYVVKEISIAFLLISLFDFFSDFEWRFWDWIIDHNLLVHSVWLTKILGDN